MGGPVEFIYSIDMTRFTDRKIILGLAFLVGSGIFLASSALFLAQAMSIIDYGGEDIYRVPIGCDSCQGAREALLVNLFIFGIVGGIIGSFGAWFLISGYRGIEKAGLTR